MIDLIIKAFYFMLPAYFANMAPVIIRKWFSSLKFPLDFNKKINNKPILGNHKTFRGIIFMILFAIIFVYLQSLFFRYEFFKSISLIDYSNWLLFGLLMGVGVMFGDLTGSFIKRRLNLEPGAKFIPWSQIDYILGYLLFTGVIFKIDLYLFLIIMVLSFILYMIVNHAAFYLKIREVKW